MSLFLTIKQLVKQAVVHVVHGFLTTNIDIRTSHFVESLINLLDLLRTGVRMLWASHCGWTQKDMKSVTESQLLSNFTAVFSPLSQLIPLDAKLVPHLE